MWKSKALPGNHLSLTMAYQLWTAHHAALTILVSKQFSVEGETYVICSLKLSLSVDVLSSNNNLLLFVWRYLLLSLLLSFKHAKCLLVWCLDWKIDAEVAMRDGYRWGEWVAGPRLCCLCDPMAWQYILGVLMVMTTGMWKPEPVTSPSILCFQFQVYF